MRFKMIQAYQQDAPKVSKGRPESPLVASAEAKSSRLLPQRELSAEG